MSENCDNTQLENIISAYHEAGHVTVMLHFGWKQTCAHLDNTAALEQTKYNENRVYESLTQAHQAITVAFAGNITVEQLKSIESFIFETAFTAKPDKSLIGRICTAHKISEATTCTLEANAKNIISLEWPKVETIARKILIHGHFCANW